MRLIAATLVSFALAAPALGQGGQSGPKTAKGTPMPTLVLQLSLRTGFALMPLPVTVLGHGLMDAPPQ